MTVDPVKDRKGSQSWCIGSDSSDPKSHSGDVVKTLYNQWLLGVRVT